MIILQSTDLLRVITSAAVNTDVHASYVDGLASITPGRLNTLITTATATTIVGPPAAGAFRTVKHVSIRNRGTTLSQTVTVVHSDGTNVAEIVSHILTPGSGLFYEEGNGWRLETNSNLTTPDIQIFNGVGGTWNKPAGAKQVIVEIIGGGGGGGGGASLATAVVAKGGGGGGGGAWLRGIFNANDLGETEAVTIGTGGAAGTPGAAGAAGGGGGIGGHSTFGTWLTAFGGGGGSGGATSAAVTGGGGGGGEG